MIDHIDVFFVSPPNGWAAAPFDGDGNQIEEAKHTRYKSDAIALARTEWHGDDNTVHVYQRNGHLGLIIPARHSLPERFGTVWKD